MSDSSDDEFSGFNSQEVEVAEEKNIEFRKRALREAILNNSSEESDGGEDSEEEMYLSAIRERLLAEGLGDDEEGEGEDEGEDEEEDAGEEDETLPEGNCPKGMYTGSIIC